MKRKVEDEQMWIMGMYVESAVQVAVERNLAGKKSKSKYIEKPILQKVRDENYDLLTEDEKLEKVKALFASLEARKKEFDREKTQGR